ncbi:carbonic anhydrase [Streptomyces sp. NPDC050738]|uniref:carbonic anhydrase n=1 Tax=Streptomyces sp. NPDC050738 TaxID=3154744 RepID=UPI003434D688
MSAAVSAPLPSPLSAPEDHTSSAARALTRLRAGNSRYAALRARHPRQDEARRRTVALTQHPFAVVLGCIDSRVPPEIVFDAGLGDLLCVRTAGPSLDEATLGSLQFGVEELGVRLVVVLGHERCGAISATVEHARTGTTVRGHLARVVDEIAPAVCSVRAADGDWVENALRAHVARVGRTLSCDPAFTQAVVVGARFDLDTGRISFSAF